MRLNQIHQNGNQIYQDGAEDREHFIALCTTLSGTREKYITISEKLLKEHLDADSCE